MFVQSRRRRTSVSLRDQRCVMIAVDDFQIEEESQNHSETVE